MGHKSHPKSLRLGYTQDWVSKWFDLKKMPDFIEEDYRIRIFLKNKLKLASVSKIVIERSVKSLRISLHTARPGIVIGKGGQGIENLKVNLEKITLKKITINVIEIKKPELDAQLVSENIAFQLEKHMAFRRIMKKAIEKAISSGINGIKVMISGRIGGAEIARTEWIKNGRLPLQTFRADIDYGFSEAKTTMGQIGVKVWIFKKELFKKKTIQELATNSIIKNNK
ncbi:MAG: 30S ribosomal protein S3 [Endomicrobium sp.]|jgi:small subunit ribosomal protein S3|nr:30S ribosomal protein S3 [Endomicrobium sp.]